VSLQRELEPYVADYRREAASIVQDWLDNVIVTLRRDPRFSSIPRHDFELLLADQQAIAESRLANALRDRVHLDDVDYIAGDGE
jgi:hypothetical protein